MRRLLLPVATCLAVLVLGCAAVPPPLPSTSDPNTYFFVVKSEISQFGKKRVIEYESDMLTKKLSLELESDKTVGKRIRAFMKETDFRTYEIQNRDCTVHGSWMHCSYRVAFN